MFIIHLLLLINVFIRKFELYEVKFYEQISSRTKNILNNEKCLKQRTRKQAI